MVLLIGLVVGIFIGAKWPHLTTVITDLAGTLVQKVTDKLKEYENKDKSN